MDVRHGSPRRGRSRSRGRSARRSAWARATVVFRVEGGRALLARTPDLLDLAGAVEVPAELRGVAWDEVRRRARAARFRHEP